MTIAATVQPREYTRPRRRSPLLSHPARRAQLYVAAMQDLPADRAVAAVEPIADRESRIVVRIELTGEDAERVRRLHVVQRQVIVPPHRLERRPQSCRPKRNRYDAHHPPLPALLGVLDLKADPN